VLGLGFVVYCLGNLLFVIWVLEFVIAIAIVIDF
jgi:hypothetical protein